MYQIEKNVPFTNEHGAFTNTLVALEVGDSFVFPKIKTTQGIGGRMSQVRKNFPERKFTARAVEGGVRIWRLA